MKNRTWKQLLKSFIPKTHEVLVSVPIFIIAVFIIELYHLQDHSFWWIVGLLLVTGIISQLGNHVMEGLLSREYDKGYDNGYADGEHDTQNLQKAD